MCSFVLATEAEAEARRASMSFAPRSVAAELRERVSRVREKRAGAASIAHERWRPWDESACPVPWSFAGAPRASIDLDGRAGKWRCGDLVFRADFDGGNLAKVARARDNCYHVWTRPDCDGTPHETRHRTWFHFSVEGDGARRGETVTFTIMNLNKQGKLFNNGFRPVYRTHPAMKAYERVTEPCKTHVTDDGAFKVTFKHRFEKDLTAPGEKVFFAFTYPFGAYDCEAMLDAIDARFEDPTHGEALREVITYGRETLATSLDGRKVEMITITGKEVRGGDGGGGGGGGGGDGDNVALVASSSGRLWHWHCTSGKTIGAPVVEPGNQILACYVRGDGETFATAGYDGTIRVYDEATRKLRASLRGWSAGEDPATGAPTRPPWKPAGPPKMVHVGNGEYREKSIVNPVKDCGHADRVLGLAYASDSHDVLVSGGWDNTLQMWDARAGPTSVRRVRGPHVCGDSIHVTPLNDDGARAQVLCGSWRTRRPLQAFDLGTFMFMYEVPFGVVPDAKGEENANANATPCSVYAARFGKDGGPCEGLIFAGGSGGNEVRVISRPGYGDHSGGKARSVFFALVPIRPRSRGERRFLMRSFFAISRVVFLSADPPLGFNARPRRLSTLTDAFELHPDVCRFA